jgi:hypothetical protein
MNPTELVPKSSARVYYYLAFWVTVLQAGAIALLWRYLPTVVPLFFTVPWGEARLAPKMYLAVLPTLSLVTIVTNLILGKSAKEVSPVLVYTLAIASLFIVVMFSFAVGGIVQSIL